VIAWLDMLLFGSGNGLGAPYWDQRFYWLCDGLTQKSRFYTWIGGYGAQLQSFAWTHPKAGTEIEIAGEKLRIFSSHRSWIRVRCSWALTRLPADVDDSQAAIKRFESRLGDSKYTTRR
jgi:hypothetical protein